MEYPGSFTAVLDSSVLFPVFISNILLWIADSELYRPKWTEKIHEEWIEKRLERYSGERRDALEHKRLAMNENFPDSLVVDYEALIDGLVLPDENDRHVLAAAIKCGADTIVTDNIKDFPAAELKKYSVAARNPDDFILDQIDLTLSSPKQVAIALVNHKQNMTRSKPDWEQYIEKTKSVLPKVGKVISEKRFLALLLEVESSGEWDE